MTVNWRRMRRGTARLTPRLVGASIALGILLMPLGATLIAPFCCYRGSGQSRELSNLHQLGQVLEMYAENNHGRLPPMESVAALRHALDGYVMVPRGPDSIYRDPRSGTLFLLNPALSRRKVSELDPSSVAIASPRLDLWGERLCLLVDGRIRRLGPAEAKPAGR